jgi:hypothetical protein
MYASTMNPYEQPFTAHEFILRKSYIERKDIQLLVNLEG